MLTASKAKRLYKKVRYAGGFTYSVSEESHPTSGYSVATADRERQFYAAEFGYADILEYYTENSDLLEQPGYHLGAWAEDGIIYLDVSMIVYELGAAQTLANEWLQIAFYNLSEQETVYA